MSEVRSGCAVRAAIQDDEAAKLNQEAKLVAFFRSPEGDKLGRDGDHDNLSPADTAIRAMKRVAELEEQISLAEKMGKRICRDLRHAIDEIADENEMKALMSTRHAAFEKMIGDTADYQHNIHLTALNMKMLAERLSDTLAAIAKTAESNAQIQLSVGNKDSAGAWTHCAKKANDAIEGSDL